MIFPFSVKYKKQLATEVIDDSLKNDIVNKIIGELKSYGINDVTETENEIRFRNYFSNQLFSWQLFLPVDSGMFFLDTLNKKLNYEIVIIKLPVITTIMSTIIGIAAKSWWPIALGICLFYGVNLFIALVRHQILFDGLVNYFNEIKHITNHSTGNPKQRGFL